jgi:hypothetical protein
MGCMSDWKFRHPAAVALFVLIPLILLAQPQSKTKRSKYSLTKFHNGCMAKGRVQDCGGDVLDQILADGKSAIPILISQLTETAPAKFEIADFWWGTRSGDVAYVILTDLFSDADGKTFGMPGAPGWSIVSEGCQSTAQGCWSDYVHKHGRLSVQRAWLRAWNLNKEKVYWDAKARCFRLAGEKTSLGLSPNKNCAAGKARKRNLRQSSPRPAYARNYISAPLPSQYA